MDADAIQVQDRDRAREKEERPSPRCLTAQVGDQRLLGRLVEPLFQHIDDQDRGAFGFQSGKQSNQCRRRGRPVSDEAGKRSIDPRFQGGISLQSYPRFRAAVRRRSTPRNAASGSVSARRLASRVFPQPSGPMI